MPNEVMATQLLPVLGREVGNDFAFGEVEDVLLGLDELPLLVLVRMMGRGRGCVSRGGELTFMPLAGVSWPNSFVSDRIERYWLLVSSLVSVAVPKYTFPAFWASILSWAEARGSATAATRAEERCILD